VQWQVKDKVATGPPEQEQQAEGIHSPALPASEGIVPRPTAVAEAVPARLTQACVKGRYTERPEEKYEEAAVASWSKRLKLYSMAQIMCANSQP